MIRGASINANVFYFEQLDGVPFSGKRQDAFLSGHALHMVAVAHGGRGTRCHSAPPGLGCRYRMGPPALGRLPGRQFSGQEHADP